MKKIIIISIFTYSLTLFGQQSISTERITLTNLSPKGMENGWIINSITIPIKLWIRTDLKAPFGQGNQYASLEVGHISDSDYVLGGYRFNGKIYQIDEIFPKPLEKTLSISESQTRQANGDFRFALRVNIKASYPGQRVFQKIINPLNRVGGIRISENLAKPSIQKLRESNVSIHYVSSMSTSTDNLIMRALEKKIKEKEKNNSKTLSPAVVLGGGENENSSNSTNSSNTSNSGYTSNTSNSNNRTQVNSYKSDDSNSKRKTAVERENERIDRYNRNLINQAKQYDKQIAAANKLENNITDLFSKMNDDASRRQEAKWRELDKWEREEKRKQNERDEKYRREKIMDKYFSSLSYTYPKSDDGPNIYYYIIKRKGYNSDIMYISQVFPISVKENGKWPYKSDVIKKLNRELGTNSYYLSGYFKSKDLAMTYKKRAINDAYNSYLKVYDFNIKTSFYNNTSSTSKKSISGFDDAWGAKSKSKKKAESNKKTDFDDVWGAKSKSKKKAESSKKTDFDDVWGSNKKKN